MKILLLVCHWLAMHISRLCNRWLERRGDLVRSIDVHSAFLHHRKRVYGLDPFFPAPSTGEGRFTAANVGKHAGFTARTVPSHS